MGLDCREGMSSSAATERGRLLRCTRPAWLTRIFSRSFRDMSTWRHSWSPPTVSIVMAKPPIHTIRQACSRCGCQRNPISGVITFWGYHDGCKDRPGVEDKDWTEAIEHVRVQLEAMRADGVTVQLHHAEKASRR